MFDMWFFYRRNLIDLQILLCKKFRTIKEQEHGLPLFLMTASIETSTNNIFKQLYNLPVQRNADGFDRKKCKHKRLLNLHLFIYLIIY